MADNGSTLSLSTPGESNRHCHLAWDGITGTVGPELVQGCEALRAANCRDAFHVLGKLVFQWRVDG